MSTVRSLKAVGLGLAVLTVVVLALSAGTASAASERYANTTPISIPELGKATPYPSTIPVSGLPSRITDLTVSLEGFRHDFPRGVDIVLVSPAGTAVMLVSDACGESAMTASRWVFNQDFGQPVPKDSGQCNSGGIYKPTNYPGNNSDSTWRDALPAPAPAKPYSTDLDDYVGEDPNGNWKLYVNDERTFKGGKINTGWSISITASGEDVRIPAGAAGEGGPYPVTRKVDGVDGLITDVNVSLSGIYHERPADLELLLVGPRGQKVLLMSDACGVNRAKNLAFTWDDEAAGLMPSGPCSQDNFQPTDYEPGDSLVVPAPKAPYANKLSAFDNTDPNGEWQLYVADDQADKRGFITNRFTLDIKTRPRAAVAFTSPTAEIAEGESGEVTIRRTGTQPFAAGSVTVRSVDETAAADVDYASVSTPVQFAAGQVERTVPIRALADDAREGDETYLLTVGNAGDDATVGSPAATRVTIADRTPQPRTNNDDDPGGDGPAADRQAPAIGLLRLKPARFAVGGRTARVRGTTITYRLSEAATVTLRIERLRGRRFVKAGSIKGSGKAGANRVRFTGKVGKRTLRPGSYRVVVVARDAAGNEGKSMPKRFKVVKKR